MQSEIPMVRYRWVVVVMLGVFYGAFKFFTGTAFFQIAPFIIEDPWLQLTVFQFSLVMSFFPLTNAVFSVPLGMLIDRFGIRIVPAATCAIIGIFLIVISQAKSFVAFLVLLLVSGAFVSIDFDSKTIGMWFPSPQIGTGFATFFSIYSILRGSVSMFTIPIVNLLGGSWRPYIALGGGIVIALSGAWFAIVRERPKVETEPTSSQEVKTRLKDEYKVGFREAITTLFGHRELWILNFILLLWSYARTHSDYVPLMINIKGVPLAIAALATSVIQWSSLGGALFSAISDRVGLRKPFLYGGMLSIIVGLIGLYYLFPPILFVFLGIAAVGVQTHLTMQLLVLNEIEGIGPRLAGTAMGIGSSFRFIGMWLANLTTGFILDQTGAPDWAVLLFIIVALGTFPFMFLFKECGPKTKKRASVVNTNL